MDLRVGFILADAGPVPIYDVDVIEVLYASHRLAVLTRAKLVPNFSASWRVTIEAQPYVRQLVISARWRRLYRRRRLRFRGHLDVSRDAALPLFR